MGLIFESSVINTSALKPSKEDNYEIRELLKACKLERKSIGLITIGKYSVVQLLNTFTYAHVRVHNFNYM